MITIRSLAGSVALTGLLMASGNAFPEELKPLFNGRDLSGWVEMGKPGGWVVEDGALLLKEPRNYPNWLRSEKEYENFNLKLEYLMTGWCETGIFLHAPLYGGLAQTGLKLHLRHDRTEEGPRSNGSIYDAAAPLQFANKGPKEWNTIEVEMDWPTLRVRINGVLIQDLNMEMSEALRSKARRGYIGLEDLNCHIRYRNLQIQELPDKARRWTPLSNGVDLKGWTSSGTGKWTVEGGAIVGSDGDGFLFTEASFSAFELQLYFRTTPHANGGVNYRRSGASSTGYEIQVYNVPGATNPTGSIYGIVPASEVPCRDGDWCHMRLISDGAFSAVWINGRKVAESHALKLPDRGNVGFQIHSQGRIEHLEPKIQALR
jgi:hypothetical protein